jgi:hypothetical protein
LVPVKFNGRQVSFNYTTSGVRWTNDLFQIKNIVATAHALATKRKSQVLVSHLREAVSASEKFIKEFNGGHDASRMFM